MLVVSAGSASELFTAACQAVLATGKPAAPRGLATVEVLGARLCLTDPRRRLVDVPPVRVLNPAFAAAETAWILSGSDDPWIYAYNQRLAGYADHGRLMGAYGPRLRRWHGTTDQLGQVRDLLAGDPDSRRAVVQLFDPGTDFRGYKDVPCTLGVPVSFSVTGCCRCTRRCAARICGWGFGYDIFTATVIQELLAGWLGAGLGDYHHHVDSLHLYAGDLPAVRLPTVAAPGPVTTRLAAPWEGFDDLLGRVIAGDPVTGAGWAEITGVLASYRWWKRGDRLPARLAAARVPGPLAEALCRWYDRLEQRSGMPAGIRQAGEGR